MKKAVKTVKQNTREKDDRAHGQPHPDMLPCGRHIPTLRPGVVRGGSPVSASLGLFHVSIVSRSRVGSGSTVLRGPGRLASLRLSRCVNGRAVTADT